MNVRLLAGMLAGASLLLGACSQDKSEEAAPSCAVQVDRFKELLIVDDSVIADQRAQNGSGGPWSFRHAIESVMPAGADRSTFILSWLNSWSAREFNGFRTDLEPRDKELNRLLVCPWLRETPSNGCDADCTACAARELDLTKAPFRLNAVVDRTDLGLRRFATSPAGEGRLVFGMTFGPADNPASAPAPMSVIFEYALPETSSRQEWIAAWHQLGTHPAFDEAFKTDLAGLTERFVAPGSSPSRTNATALAQIRTNEKAFNSWIWQMREFRFDAHGDLRLAPVRGTPAEALNGTPALASYILANAESIKTDDNELPPSMAVGSVDQLLFKWSAPGVSEPLRRAFAVTTCNGCHAGENAVVDTAFHISPYRVGNAKLSPFLNNPLDPANDELGKREKEMSASLCTK